MNRIKKNLKSKFKTKRKSKKAREYAALFISTADMQTPETREMFIFRIAVKILLVFMTTAGFCVTLAQVYRIPVYIPDVVLVCLASVVVFNAGLLFFKKRAVLALLFFFFMVWRESILYNLSLFGDYMLYQLNGRLLSTARFARYSARELTRIGGDEAASSAFLVICVVISLVFTIAARSRYIGVMLISAVFLFAPAFGAEIAGYVPGIEFMVAGMVGLYAAWVAHTPESPRLYPPPEKLSKTAAIFRVTPGSPPYFYRHSANALIAAAVALFASIAAASVVTDAVDFNYKAVLNSLSRVVESTRDLLNINGKTGVNDNGYFPNISNSLNASGTDISTGISLNAPPAGTKTIIRVNMEDDSEKLFLKGGIGVDFKGDEWTVGQDSYEYRRMMALLEDFTPETEYEMFKLRADTSYVNLDGGDLIGVQTVSVEYLSRMGFLLLPTNPYGGGFKENENFVWYGDTYIKAKNKIRIRETTFDVIYPKMSESDRIVRFTDVLKFSSVTESQQLKRYRELIGSIYTQVPTKEADNIERILGEIDLNQEVFLVDTTATVPVDNLARTVCDFFKNNYEYSLTADNTAGGNTTLGNFLFDTKSGHCAMYASAMTLVMRQLGYPARYVTGVVTSPNGGTTQNISEQNFHAWTEVYIEGVGWLPFDPTGGVNGEESGEADETASETAAQSADETSVAEETEQSAEETENSEPSETSETEQEEDPAVTSAADGEEETPPMENAPKNGGKTVIIISAIALILAAAAAVISVFGVKKAEANRFARFKNGRDGKTASEMYRFLLRLLRKRGIKAMTGETPLEFAARADRAELIPPPLSLNAIMPVFEKLEFGDEPLTDEEYDSLYDYVCGLRFGTVKSV